MLGHERPPLIILMPVNPGTNNSHTTKRANQHWTAFVGPVAIEQYNLKHQSCILFSLHFGKRIGASNCISIFSEDSEDALVYRIS